MGFAVLHSVSLLPSLEQSWLRIPARGEWKEGKRADRMDVVSAGSWLQAGPQGALRRAWQKGVSPP